MPNPEGAVFGSIDSFSSSQAAIEARRSLIHQQEEQRGFRRMVSGITSIGRPWEEVNRRQNIVEAMNLTGTTFLTWEESQTALDALKNAPKLTTRDKIQQINPWKDKEKYFETEVARLATKRKLATEALSQTPALDRNNEEEKAKMEYWTNQASEIGAGALTQLSGEQFVPLDNTPQLGRVFRDEVLQKIQTAAEALPESPNKQYVLKATQDKLVEEFVKKHQKDKIGDTTVGKMFGRKGNKYGDTASFMGDLTQLQDADPLILVKGSGPVDVDTRTAADKTAAFLKQHHITAAPVVGGAVIAATLINKGIPGAVKKVANFMPPAPIPFFATIGAGIGAAMKYSEMGRHKKVVMEELAYMDATPPPPTVPPNEPKGFKKVVEKATRFIGSKQERHEKVEDIYKDIAISVEDFMAQAPTVRVVNGAVEGLEGTTIDDVIQWNAQLNARVEKNVQGNVSLRYTRGQALRQQLALDNHKRMITEGSEKESQNGQTGTGNLEAETRYEKRRLESTAKTKDKEFNKLRWKETGKGALVGGVIGGLAGTAVRLFKDHLPETDVKSAIRNPKSVIMDEHTEVKQPPDLANQLFPATATKPHASQPFALFDPQHPDTEVLMKAHWSGGNEVGTSNPDWRVITPTVDNKELTVNGKQGMHTFLTADNRVVSNVQLDEDTAQKVDEQLKRFGWERRLVTDSDFNINERLANHKAQDSFRMGSARWQFEGNKVTITELDLRPEADANNNLSDHIVSTVMERDANGRMYIDDVDLLKRQMDGRNYSMFDVLKADQWVERDGKLWAPASTYEYVPMNEIIVTNDLKVDNIVALGGLAAIAGGVAVAEGVKNRNKITSFIGAKKRREERLIAEKQAQAARNWDITYAIDPNRPTLLTADEITALRTHQAGEILQVVAPGATITMEQILAKPFDERHIIFDRMFTDFNPYQHRIPIIQSNPHVITLYDVLRTDSVNPDPAQIQSDRVIELLSKLAAADDMLQTPRLQEGLNQVISEIQHEGYEIRLGYTDRLTPIFVDQAHNIITLNISLPPNILLNTMRHWVQSRQTVAVAS